MEDSSISSFCKTLASFCNHLQSTCDALKQSVDRRPIPLDSASSTFIQCLNRRVSTVSSDLNLLESMSFGTVSFEELLGNCNEVYKKNQSHIIELEDRLKSFGYVPEVEVEDEDEMLNLSIPLGLDSNLSSSKDKLDPLSSHCGSLSAADSIMKSLEEDSLLEESLSLKNLGLSDVCLATLASEANNKIDDPDISLQNFIKRHEDKLYDIGEPYQPDAKTLGVIKGEVEDDIKSVKPPKPVVKVSKEDYESLPSYMKSLVSWEDLITAVEKINSNLRKKEKTNESNFFLQDEIASLGLGPKVRSYLLLLVRMNQLVVETTKGLISYRVL